jgi:hypothetical protein
MRENKYKSLPLTDPGGCILKYLSEETEGKWSLKRTR